MSRIYSNCYDLMSETGRNLWEMGAIVTPKTYQNKVIEGNDDFITKELICEQYILTSLENEEMLFIYDQDSKPWAKAELRERVGMKPVNPGEAYLERKHLWEEFLNEFNKFDYTYAERFNHKGNFERLIDLLKMDPDTRQGILPVFSLDDPFNAGGIKRIPCSMYYSFLIRKDANGESMLHINYHQRSCDFVAHFGNDVWLAFKIMEYVAGRLNIKPGYLTHTIDSLHTYKRDWLKLKQSLNEI